MDMVNIKINGADVSAPAGSTILEAARLAGIRIPTLCFMKEINEIGACRMCVCEVKGAKALVAACVYPINEGMEVFTNTPRVVNSRKKTMQLLLSNHNRSCLSCVRSGACELQTLSQELGIEDDGYFDGAKTPSEIDDSAVHMYRDNSKCILCRRCTAACEKTQGIACIGTNHRGFKTDIGSPFEMPLASTECIHCGQCIAVCPTGALSEKDDLGRVFEALNDPTKHVVVQTAPSVRAGLGEEFGYPIGTNVDGKMVTALRALGFEKVFNTDWGADLTIMEEANELLERIQGGKTLPMFTSCSPGWVKFLEFNFPDLLDHVSSCKSPAQMQGACIKSFWAEKNGYKAKDIVVVDVMPCTAKKFEVTREDQSANGVVDCDISLTTRELARLIKMQAIDFRSLKDSEFDNPFGVGSSAGSIFGATGGVMEAALRTAVETITGETLPKLEFEAVRGTEGIKTASYEVGGITVKVCVASGLANARKVMQKVRAGEMDDYQFIEIMACPGGCVNGGGQPRQPGYIRDVIDLRTERAKVLYTMDNTETLRKSHDNPQIKSFYEDYLGKPGSHLAHHLLHTSYVKREINKYTSD